MSAAKRKPKPKSKATRKTPPANEIEFSIKPGTKTTLTIEAGKEKAGEVPVRIRVEGGKARRAAGQAEVREEAAGRRIPAWLTSVSNLDPAMGLFAGAVILYLVTRLIGLDRFPLYFFTDEAFQAQAMDELIGRGYLDIDGTKFPAYFGNGMGLTVYLQWIPLLLFGKSAVLTRVVSVMVTVIAALAVGVILRDIFKIKFWWSGVLFLSFTPAWFLHSRTAFETAAFVAFYAGALCAYLLYRYRSPRYLYLTVFLAASAFYSYNPAQLMVPVTGLVLLVSDWRYHWENRNTAIRAGLLLAILAVPYLRYKMAHPSSSGDILRLLGSYLVTDIPIAEKIRMYISEYFFGLSAWYWYIPNDRDQIRHIMKEYGHIMLATLPFALLGLARILRTLREPASRAVLFVMLISPMGGAMVQIGITRTLVFVAPAAILSAIGLDQMLRWIEDPREAWRASPSASSPTGKQPAASAGILLAGAVLAYVFDKTVDRVSVAVLAILLGFHGLGYFEKLKQWLRSRFSGWKIHHGMLSIAAFVVLAGVNIHLLRDALTNGPFWWKGQYAELQYGSFQIYDIIKDYHQEHPEARIVFTSSWANGADVLNRFFIGIRPWLEGGSIDGYLLRRLPLDENTVFIMAPNEFAAAQASDKLTDIRVERIVPYPDGSPAFYLVRLRYSDNADELFAAERALRAVLQEGVVTVGGQQTPVRFTYLDAAVQAEAIKYVFDDDLYTLAKTLEDNPFVIELDFPSPRTISGFSISIHSATAQITLTCYPSPEAEPVVFTFEGRGSEEEPVLTFELPQAVQVQRVRLEMFDPHSPPPSQVHIWELTFRYND